MNRIIAIDFDNTITNPSPYPVAGSLNKYAKKYITLLSQKGYIFVLWTSRRGEFYKEACNLIRKWGLPIEVDNLDRFPRGDGGKLEAGYYIDDNACFGKVNWRKIYRYLDKKSKDLYTNGEKG